MLRITILLVLFIISGCGNDSTTIIPDHLKLSGQLPWVDLSGEWENGIPVWDESHGLYSIAWGNLRHSEFDSVFVSYTNDQILIYQHVQDLWVMNRPAIRIDQAQASCHAVAEAVSQRLNLNLTCSSEDEAPASSSKLSPFVLRY